MVSVTSSALDLFDPIQVQTSMVAAAWSDYHTISDPATSAQLEFYIPGSQDQYVDFNDTKLYLEVSLQATPHTAVVAPANNILGTLFSDVSVFLNDTPIQGGEPYYPYKAIIESLLLFDNETKKTQLRARGFIKDESGKFDDEANAGHKVRVALFANSKRIELVGPLHVDLATQPRYILPRVDIRVRMVRAAARFTVNAFGVAPKSTKIIIHKAWLSVRRVSVLPSVQLGHELGLARNNAMYPVQHVSMDSHTVPAGQQTFTRENIFRGRMPKFMVMGMVSNDAYTGKYKANPFNFQSFDISHLGLYREGECLPERTPYEMEHSYQYVRPFMGTIHALEQFNRNQNNGITLDDFMNGNMLFAFNLTPDMAMGGNSGGCQQAYRIGNLRLEARFRQPLAKPVNVIYYGVFDGKIEITKDRAVTVDFS